MIVDTLAWFAFYCSSMLKTAVIILRTRLFALAPTTPHGHSGKVRRAFRVEVRYFENFEIFCGIIVITVSQYSSPAT